MRAGPERLPSCPVFAAELAVKRPKDAAIILLAALLALTFWRFNRERGRAQELAAKIEGLPPDTKQVVTIYRDRVVTKWRDDQD